MLETFCEPTTKRKRMLLRSIVTGVVLLALIVACRSAISAPEEEPSAQTAAEAPPPRPSGLSAEAARRALARGLEAYRAEKYHAAARAFRRAARGPRGVPRGRARYMLGLTQLALEQYARARESLLVASREYVVLGDHALYYAGKAALAAGDHTGGIRTLSQLRLNYLNSVWRADAARLVGLSFLKIKNPQAARKALARALGEGVSAARVPATRLAFGEAQELSGNLTAAVRVYRDVWLRYPETTAGDEAGARFTRILRREGRKPPYTSYATRGERADRLYDRFSYEKALEAYQKLLREARQKGDGEEIYRLSTRVAHSLFRLKRYPEATPAFREIRAAFPRRKGIEKTLFWEARSLTHEGRFDDALAMHRRLIARHGRSRWARESRYRLALLLEDRQRLDKAAAAFRDLLKRGPGSYRKDAQWRLGWIAWKQKRLSRSLEQFRALAGAGMGDTQGRRGAYWAARVHERQGRPKEAASLYRDIVTRAPLSYYRFAAETRLAGLGGAIGRDLRPLAPRPRLRALSTRAGLGAHYERGLELALLDQDEDAALELAEVRYGADLRLYFARLFQEVEDYYSASKLILRRHAGAMSRSVKQTHYLLRFTYPDAYAVRVRAEAARYGIDPRMAWAVMREESTYRPRIRSPAGAVGLMQVMPATAERLERKIGVAGAAKKLENPAVNIRLGTYYLSWLMKRYGGRVPRALAGYNAGEDAVDRWLKELPAAILKEPDAFIEEIPYGETRNYVKKVLKSYHVYQRLYPEAGKATGK